jgi:hypothetical protein
MTGEINDIERKTIIKLGRWLCRELEQDLKRTGFRGSGLLSTTHAEGLKFIRAVSDKIEFYLDSTTESGE